MGLSPQNPIVVDPRYLVHRQRTSQDTLPELQGSRDEMADGRWYARPSLEYSDSSDNLRTYVWRIQTDNRHQRFLHFTTRDDVGARGGGREAFPQDWFSTPSNCEEISDL